MKNFLTITLLLILTTSVSAKDFHKETPEERQQRREQIMNAKIAFFTSEMELTPEEAQVFWPLYNEFFSETNKAHRNTKEALYKLKKMIKEDASSTKQIEEQLLIYTNHYEKEGEVYKNYYNKFMKILSPEKVARLYISEEAFREKMIDLLRESHPPQPQDTKKENKNQSTKK